MRLTRLSSSLCGGGNGLELAARRKELEEAHASKESKSTAQLIAASANLFLSHNISLRMAPSFLVLAHKEFFKRLLDGLNRDEAAASAAQRREHRVNIPFVRDLYAHAARRRAK